MEELLTALQTRLQGLLYHGLNADLAQPPTDTLEYVDVDWGQLDYYERQPPVKFPCALLDIRTMDYSNLGQGLQIGIVNIEVRVADMVLSHSSGGAPTTQRANAMRIYRLVEAVFARLHGWRPLLPVPPIPPALPTLGGFGPLTRISGSKIKRADGIKEMRLVFRVQCSEEKARR